QQQALLQAMRAVLAPLADLAVAQGLPYADAEEAWRRAFVEAAQRAQAAQGQPAQRAVSRIAAATGINRREVTRLTQAEPLPPIHGRASMASQVLTRWVSDPAWSVAGKPRTLPRQGEDSFETLARSVTQDVHPRTVLDELVRLKLARWDTDTDAVSLLEEAFTPHGDLLDMLSFLGTNVSDHLQAAVGNVLSPQPQHFEQAVFAQGLPASAAEDLRVLARRHWKALMAEAVPLLEAGLRDAAAQREQGQAPEVTHRVRLGLFTYHDPGETPASETSVQDGGAVRRRAAKRD
ncbi:MAG: hypothetical protein RI907_2673, partial [Pseudomonadota bacterium]